MNKKMFVFIAVSVIAGSINRYFSIKRQKEELEDRERINKTINEFGDRLLKESTKPIDECSEQILESYRKSADKTFKELEEAVNVMKSTDQIIKDTARRQKEIENELRKLDD